MAVAGGPREVELYATHIDDLDTAYASTRTTYAFGGRYRGLYSATISAFPRASRVVVVGTVRDWCREQWRNGDTVLVRASLVLLCTMYNDTEEAVDLATRLGDDLGFRVGEANSVVFM